MMNSLRMRAGMAFAALAMLTACGNGPDSNVIAKLPEAIKAARQQSAAISPEQLAQALGGTTGPVTMFVIEDRESQVVMVDIESNGPYHTFGASSRQVVVMRDGMITATRGLGGDLMSSDEGALLSLVRRRSVGTATYVQRYLTPEDVTETYQFTCKLDTGATVPVVTGLINTKGQTVTAKCGNDEGTFTNTYVVSADGYILSSRVWLGKTLGYVLSQALRR
ncbi:YjbF family lipoprotein [Tropicibacter naphthalenivorans]|uniref:Group 4 capsule polysaccharide lipoprotein gfcB, YjbF n=1 Tax=Tropicibacter naphthalenivorans TaxID=441103 RepID=A0A0P1GDT8_9RHOB|nr:YjbF family lipoprotein [Tropicibacter naphthalenivorans]CUH79680.1 hypothetical protein TRN7648_02594 [Tropicibacter naphthalenivorans]SMC74407.1 Group 4 capsule polysaccharide lipoprotein gfcB, YjbF [Tropicibacter naphthalenivorans]